MGTDLYVGELQHTAPPPQHMYLTLFDCMPCMHSDAMQQILLNQNLHLVGSVCRALDGLTIK